jgi:hypothetical protein
VGTHSVPDSDSGSEDEDSEDAEAEGEGLYVSGFGSALEPAGGVVGVVGGAAGEAAPSDIVPWTDAGGRTAVVIKNLELEHGHEYVVSVRATNGVGLESVGSSEPVLVDLTPPEGQEITLLERETTDGYPNSLRFELSYGEDAETEVAAHYFGVGSSATTADLFPWTEASLDFGRIVNLPFSPNEPVYFSVRAVNVLGTESVVTRELTFDFADQSPPQAPGVVTEPGGSSTDGSRLAIGWNGVEDAESGIAGYAYGISSTALDEPAEEPAGDAAAQMVPEPDIVGWITVEPEREPYYIGKRVAGEIGGMQVMGFGQVAGDLQIADGADGGLDAEFVAERTGLALSGTVYAVVRVTNGAGLSTIASAPPLLVDGTRPESAVLRAEAVQTEPNVLRFSVEGSDRESGIAAYRYRIYRVTDALVATPWIATSWQALDAAPGESASRSIAVTSFPSPGLEYGRSYDVRAELRNGAGLSRTTATRRIQLQEPEPESGAEGNGEAGEKPPADGAAGDGGQSQYDFRRERGQEPPVRRTR